MAITMEGLLKVSIEPTDYMKMLENSLKYATWKSNMEHFSPNNKTVVRFKMINKQFTIICFSAHWCKDCVHHIPALMATLGKAANGRLRLAFIGYDENKETAEKAGVKAIPTIIVFDDKGMEIGRITEHPSKGFKTIEDEVLAVIAPHE
ncbi:MAG: thioredoxin family protein [Candidatus Atabeyarchaeum deiterrae]